jgi:hypothetical protein
MSVLPVPEPDIPDGERYCTGLRISLRTGDQNGANWVVSANVNRQRSTRQQWIQAILLNESAYMGWSKNDPKGKIFAEIAPNDLLLIAYGSMKNHGAGRSLVACGRVKDNRAAKDPRVSDLEHSQFARLQPFVPLDDDPTQNAISLKGTLFDGNPQPPAVFELRRDDTRHPGNSDLCGWLDRRLKSSQRGRLTHGRESDRVIANTVRIGSPAKTDGYEVRTRRQVIQAIRREERLVQAFQRTRKGMDRKRYKTGEDIRYCDLYDPKKRYLIEAKASTRREDVRMAIGQLFDYENLTQAAGLGKSKLAVLLPEKPPKDIERLLDSLRIASIWKCGRTFKDNRNDRFLR